MKTLRGGLAVVALLHKHSGSLSLSDIVTAAGLPRSSVHALLRCLIEQGMASRTGRGTYGRGPLLLSYANPCRLQDRLLREGGEVLHILCGELGETSQLSVFDGETVEVVAVVEGTQTISASSTTGVRLPLNWTAAGRLLVSDLSDKDLRRKLPALVRPSPTGRAPTGVRTLLGEIRAARRRGVATQNGHVDEFTGAVAAPVLLDGRCIAAVGVVAPRHRLAGGAERRIRRFVKKAASELSRRLA